MRHSVQCSLAILSTCVCLSCGRAPSTADADPLVGIWTVTKSFGPAVHGDVTVDTDAHTHPSRATVAGYSAVMTERNSPFTSLALPHGAGEPLAWEAVDLTDHLKVRALWIQPRGTVHFSGYVTPVEMRQTGPSTWAGQLAPLEDRITFYVLIRRVNGALTAIIRNPEFNWLARTSYQVETSGDRVTLRAANGAVSGRYDRQHDTLTLPLVDLSPPVPPLQLRRVTEKEAAGLFARAGENAGAWSYRKPAGRGDGWETASLADAGIDEARIKWLIQKIISSDPSDLHAPAIHSILIARHGKLALEEYFYGTDANQPHDMRSAGKTWAPMLVDIARWHYGHGYLRPSSKVLPRFGLLRPRANIDARKERMTVEDLMTMTSGLDCDDNNEESPGNEDRMQSQQGQPDWYKYTLDLPMVRDPGGDHAIYCSAGINLAAGVAFMATKNDIGGDTPLSVLFDYYVARPLQFGTYHLNLMPTGEVYFGGGAYIRPRDQLKLGQVYLNGGVWQGRRVVSDDWVAASIAHHSTFKSVNDLDIDHGYGYAWHLHHFRVNGHDYQEYAAEGNGGQLVMVVPDLDMVIEISAGNYGDRNWYRWALRLVPDYLIPAANRP